MENTSGPSCLIDNEMTLYKTRGLTRGIPVVDADQIARDVVEPGQPALQELAEAFGQDIIREDGSLDRAGLAAKAFVDAEHTALLNSITHPRIAEETARRFAAAEEAGEAAIVYDMPLLVDKGLDRQMDLVVVVDVAAEERVRRLVAKRGLEEADVRRRIEAQVSDDIRRAAADVLIDNNGPIDALVPQVDELVEEIRSRAA